MRDAKLDFMRTTVNIDDELLAALKELARRQDVTLGQVISELVCQSLPATESLKVRNGVRLFRPKTPNAKSDLQIVNALRDAT
jgi:hypothetical protein